MSRAAMNDLVVILPGVTGSVLQRNGRDVWNVSARAIWSLAASLGGSVRALRLEADPDLDADVAPDGIRATALIDDAHLVPGLCKVDGYTRLPKALAEEFELYECGLDDDEPGNFLRFPYDWRRDVRASARRLRRVLRKKLDLWRKTGGTRGSRVILVAHSMGGLVAQYYLEVLEGWADCRALITFGTPYRGSVQTIQYLAHGYKLAVFELTEVMQSFPSVYQLLPRYPVIATGSGLKRVSQLAEALGLDPAKIRAHVELHAELDAAWARHKDDLPYQTEGYITIPVVGTRQPTLLSASWDGQRLTTGRPAPAGLDPQLADGDGTVPRVSAVPLPQSDPRDFRGYFVGEQHAALQNHPFVLVDLIERFKQLQGPDLSNLRGELVKRLPRALSLELDDLYAPGEPVVIRRGGTTARPRPSRRCKPTLSRWMMMSSGPSRWSRPRTAGRSRRWPACRRGCTGSRSLRRVGMPGPTRPYTASSRWPETRHEPGAPVAWRYHKLENDWAVLARFVQVNARKWLDEPLAVNWNDLNRDPEGRRKVIQKLYEVLCGCRINYTLEPYNPDAAIQEIRTPTEILHNPREGNCLDLSLLFCGLCLGCDLAPWLIVTQGHAFVAVALQHRRSERGNERKFFSQGPLRQMEQQVREALAKHYLILECTGSAHGRTFDPNFPEGQGRNDHGLLPFDEALKAGSAQLDCKRRPFKCALDMAVALEPVARQGWGIQPDDLEPPAGRLAQKARDTGVLPYLADRTTQIQTIEDEVHRGLGDDRGRPLVFLIEGDYGQGHNGLIRRLRQHDLPKLFTLAGKAEKVADGGLVSLPRAGAADFGGTLRRGLATSLIGRDAGATPSLIVRDAGATTPTWAELARHLRDCRFLFTSSYTTTAWEEDRKQYRGRTSRVRQFLGAWEECDDLPPDHAPIVCLKIIYEQCDDPWQPGLWGRFFPTPNAQLADHLDELGRKLAEDRVYPRIHAVRLPRLDGVRPADLDEWQDQPLVKSFSREADFTTRIEDLFAGVSDKLPMSKVVTALDSWLKTYAMEA